MELSEEEAFELNDYIQQLPDEFWKNLEASALESELNRQKRDEKLNKARMLLDEGKIKLSEYLTIINQ